MTNTRADRPVDAKPSSSPPTQPSSDPGRGRVAGGKLSKNDSLGLRAYRELRERLMTLALLPGDRFTESQLIAELGIGRTPVREALGMLAHEGLIVTRPRVGYIVAPITIQSVSDLFGLRLVVEPAAAEIAAGNIDAPKLARLEELCQTEYLSEDPLSIERFLDANYNLHVGIAEATGNSRLVKVVSDVLEESRRIMYVRHRLDPDSERYVHDHAELLDALARGDSARAKELQVEQIIASRDECVAMLLSESRLTEVPLSLALTSQPGR